MNNYIQDGDIVTVISPGGGVVSGDGVLVGSLFGVATSTVAAGADLELCVEGVVDLPKAAGGITQGAKLYWDNTAKKITTTATSNTLVGCAIVAAATGDATVRIRLNGAVG